MRPETESTHELFTTDLAASFRASSGGSAASSAGGEEDEEEIAGWGQHPMRSSESNTI
jgi:hypothetical protein